MLENLKYKDKRVLIIVIFLMLLFVAYKKLIIPTYNNFNNYYTLKNKNLDSLQLKQEIKNLTKELENLNQIIGKDSNEKLIQQNILSFANKMSDSMKIRIISLEKQHLFKANNIIIYSNFLKIQGNYNSILKTIYKFENEFEYSKINSIELYIKKDNYSKKKKLYAKILFQNFKKVL